MSARQTKLFMNDLLPVVSDGLFEYSLDYADDKYIVMQSPRSRPAGWFIKYNEDLMKFANRPTDDPERQKFLEEMDLLSCFASIVEWNLEGAPGTKYEGQVLPLATDEDRTGWDNLMQEEQNFLQTLVIEAWYGNDLEQRKRILGLATGKKDDPKNSISSTTRSDSTPLSAVND
jgi:hypothetical protein